MRSTLRAARAAAAPYRRFITAAARDRAAVREQREADGAPRPPGLGFNPCLGPAPYLREAPPPERGRTPAEATGSSRRADHVTAGRPGGAARCIMGVPPQATPSPRADYSSQKPRGVGLGAGVRRPSRPRVSPEISDLSPRVVKNHCTAHLIVFPADTVRERSALCPAHSISCL